MAESVSRGRVDSAAEVRRLARAGQWLGTTSGHAPSVHQANLVILPRDVAVEFASFCSRNPKPCPILEITTPGDPVPHASAPDADLRTDVPGYRIFRRGELVGRAGDINAEWRDDLVSFLLGCSHTFEHALVEAGVSVRNVECGTTVPMFRSNIRCRPAGPFTGPVVVTMRPIPSAQLSVVFELSARYPQAHGSPLHAGDPSTIGINDLGHPDWGEQVDIRPGEVPVFWACGVTPQAVALEARPELMITHEPGQMFVTDLPREAAVLTP
ncbi:MAG: putative hydro-lyase [Candidatus Dormibacteraeota bacterium]|nr:putative hydro-lyase [Candidatus Dormibacteraeota bacterium]